MAFSGLVLALALGQELCLECISIFPHISRENYEKCRILVADGFRKLVSVRGKVAELKLFFRIVGSQVQMILTSSGMGVEKKAFQFERLFFYSEFFGNKRLQFG